VLASLSDYVSRMKPDQKEIFYLAGESRRVIERSPHLEELRDRGYEVLYMTEPVDELVTQALDEFQGHRLRSAAKGALDLGGEAERDRAEQDAKANAEKLSALLQWMAKHLESRVSAVQISKRLKSSPACLTGAEFDMSPHIERILRGKTPQRRRTLELNAQHPIVTRLHDRFAADAADPLVPKTADLLFGMALLAEGSELQDPVEFTTLVTDLLQQALDPA
jgi:molecular chaperone HtpG